MDYYKDKVCIVTGASSGIGFAISERLLKAGATVFMASRNAEKLEQAYGRFSDYGDRVFRKQTDVTKNEEVENLIKDAAAHEGKLDILINNAGILSVGPIESFSLDSWKRIIDTNLWSVIYAIHAAIPVMLDQGFGHIVNIASLAGLLPFPLQGSYCATKYAVVGLSECMRLELQYKGIDVSSVCPGNVVSSILKDIVEDSNVAAPKVPDDSIPADQAAEEILKGVAEKQAIIVVPERLRSDLKMKSQLQFYEHDPANPVLGYLNQIAKERLDNWNKGIFNF